LLLVFDVGVAVAIGAACGRIKAIFKYLYKG
jgi:hypothetical protein